MNVNQFKTKYLYDHIYIKIYFIKGRYLIFGHFYLQIYQHRLPKLNINDELYPLFMYLANKDNGIFIDANTNKIHNKY